jgi:hypothetical protein
MPRKCCAAHAQRGPGTSPGNAEPPVGIGGLQGCTQRWPGRASANGVVVLLEVGGAVPRATRAGDEPGNGLQARAQVLFALVRTTRAWAPATPRSRDGWVSNSSIAQRGPGQPGKGQFARHLQQCAVLRATRAGLSPGEASGIGNDGGRVYVRATRAGTLPGEATPARQARVAHQGRATRAGAETPASPSCMPKSVSSRTSAQQGPGPSPATPVTPMPKKCWAAHAQRGPGDEPGNAR